MSDSHTPDVSRALYQKLKLKTISTAVLDPTQKEVGMQIAKLRGGSLPIAICSRRFALSVYELALNVLR